MRVTKPVFYAVAALTTAAAALVLMRATGTVDRLTPSPLYAADPIGCDLSQYRASSGLTAAAE
ncbi:MAG: hypothetical protein HY654_12500, partial [Acidobacteria bacterium]|nr:hypothetical protein [Acidobacteriota bacterium]